MLLEQPFPAANNPAAPDPSDLLAASLRQGPLPTNAFWLNFILNRGSAPEYIHPYIIKSEGGALSISYPSRVVEPNYIYQAFVPNLTMRASNENHVVTHFDDLSVMLEFRGGVAVPLVRGCPYVTFDFRNYSTPQFSTKHEVIHVIPNEGRTKHRIVLSNGQTWLMYSSEPLALLPNLSASQKFKGVIRVALLPGSSDSEAILDQFSSAYPVEGVADLSLSFQLTYKWKKCGWGRLLMLSLPMHRDIMTSPSFDDTFHALTYKSMDGNMHGVVGDAWVLEETPISVGWYSSKGISDQVHQNTLAEVVRKEVNELVKITTDSSYFYGKAVARAARMALIAEEVGAYDILKEIQGFLINSLTPWMDGGFQANGFLYDEKWGGLTTLNGSRDAGADFGFGVYNDHHYHLGYFCYAGAVLAKLDPKWGKAYKAHLYTMVEDYMTFHGHNRHAGLHSEVRHGHGQHCHHHHLHPSRSKALFPRFRNFDFWVLHSWAGGLTEFADGRNQESTSEAVNAYYSAALLGLAFGDSQLVSTGLTLTAFEIRAARALWHIPLESNLYEESFVVAHRVVGVLWANKRDTGLWFAPSEWRETRLGIQVLPILPVTEILFQDINFAKELVEWAQPSLSRPGVVDGWKGFVYALQALYAPEEALQNVNALSGHDDGNSLANMLWWIYSRWSWE